MQLITPHAIASITPKLKLQAKLQSLKWADEPEELVAFFRNLRGFIYRDCQPHGAYHTHVTTFMVGDIEFSRVALASKTDKHFIPSIEAFISPDGKIYFHIVWTAIGERDGDVDAYISKHFTNYICSQFDDPSVHIAVIIHRRWKQNPQDLTAHYDSVEWGHKELCQLGHDLIKRQQEIARLAKENYRRTQDNLNEVKEALSTRPPLPKGK